MKGFPQSLNTKEDYLYIIENFPKEIWIKELQCLLDTKDYWYYIHNVPSLKEGINNQNMKVEEIFDNDKVIYAQYERRENPNAKLFMLGFTVKEVQELIKKA